MTLKIKKLRPEAVVPEYAHGSDADAGFDLRAVEDVVLWALVPTLVKTGLSIELPPGYEAQIRSRSGLALKNGIQVLNSPGTVDPAYRGEVGVILLWNGHNPNHYETKTEYTSGAVTITADLPHRTGVYRISKGDRIAQMVVSRYEPVTFEVVEELSESARGEGGFGSSGVK